MTSKRAEGSVGARLEDILRGGGKKWEGVLQEEGTTYAKALRENVFSMFNELQEELYEQQGKLKGSQVSGHIEA